MNTDVKIARYNALRSEIIQRLSFQQQIINFSLVLGGILIPIIFSTKNDKDLMAILLLIGAILSLLLAFVSLRQQISIAQLSECIIKSDARGKYGFSEWEIFSTKDILYGHKLNDYLVSSMAISGVGFPIMVSVIYLFCVCVNKMQWYWFIVSGLIVLLDIFIFFQAMGIRNIVKVGNQRRESMDIPEEKQYEYLNHHLEYINDKIIGAFELFIKLATVIIGGVFFLRWKLSEYELNGTSFVAMSNILFWVVGISMIIHILNNLRAWLQYRKTLSEQYPKIPSPTNFWRLLNELTMCLVILMTCILFSWFNPLNDKPTFTKNPRCVSSSLTNVTETKFQESFYLTH